jgi:hypothetical protein
MDVIIVKCPSFMHNKICKYFRGKNDSNINFWRNLFKDDWFDIKWDLIDRASGTAFITISSNSPNECYAEILETLTGKLEDAFGFVQEVHYHPIDLTYRHSGMRYEMTYDHEIGCTNYNEYKQITSEC